MAPNMFTWATRRRFCSGFILLALLLVGCGTNTGHPTHTFAGKLTLLHIPTPYSAPEKMVAGSDGTIWFPAVAFANFGSRQPGGAIGSITADGKFHMFPLPSPNSYPIQLTLGPDGNIWFTLFQGNGQLAPNVDTAPRFTGGHSEIGKMTMDGKFTFLALPDPTTYARAITTGPDAQLWFTETTNTETGKIARISPSGQISEFALPTSGDFAPFLTSGSDGNLWFTIQSSEGYNAVCKVGRITPQGKISIFRPQGLYIAGDITSGPDNNLWFTSGYYVTSISPSGTIRKFSMPGSGFNRSSAASITSNSDGALWFSTPNVAIGRIATDGTIKMYPFPDNTYFDNGGSSLTLGQLKGIVASPDGTLWLNDGAQIGHFA